MSVEGWGGCSCANRWPPAPLWPTSLLFYTCASASVVVLFVMCVPSANIESPRFFGLHRSPTGRACLALAGSVAKGGADALCRPHAARGWGEWERNPPLPD